MRDPLLAAFARLAARSPAAPLLASPGRRTVSVTGLEALARLAEEALPAELPPGSLVGIAAPNGPGFLAAFLAVRRRDLAVLLLDPQAPVPEAQRAAEALGAGAILGCRNAWPSESRDFSCERVAGAGLAPLPSATSAVKLTSGSTGSPRGVAFSSDALLADDAALASTMGLRAEDVILGALPMSHSYGFASVALPALVRGSVVVVPDTSGPLAPLQAAAEFRATVFPTVPAFLQAVLKMSRPPAWPPSIRLEISAGAPLPPETAARFRQTYGRRVHVFYGASECGGICYDREGGAGERGTVGTPVEGVRVTLEPLADGGVGDRGVVVVASPAVGSAYLPDADARLGGAVFQASDLAEWRSGELRLLRRIDSLINVKGKKVDPGEIEAIVAGLKGVEEVVALGVPSLEGGSQLVRVVIACRPGLLSYEDVIAWCRPRLAEHKLPRSIMLLPEIPRTLRGKIDRAALTKFEARTARE